MTWKYFFHRFEEWDKSVLLERITELQNFGSVEELTDALNGMDEDVASFLLRKAVASGVEFSFDQIMEVDGQVNEECMEMLIESALSRGVSFTPEQIAELDCVVDQSLLSKMALMSKSEFTEDDLMELEYIVDEETLLELENRSFSSKKRNSSLVSNLGGILGVAGFLSLFDEKKSRKFKVGDHVRAIYRGQEGTVIDATGEYYLVSLKDGEVVDSFSERELERCW